MRAWSLKLGVFLVFVASLAFGQVGNGTITGTVTDPAGAVVAGAAVEAKNTETGIVFPTVSTSHRELYNSGTAGRDLHRHG